MKIVLGSDTYPPDVNGAARFTERLADGLAARGHQVHVICPSDSGAPEVHLGRGIRVHQVRSHRTRAYPAFRLPTPWLVQGEARALINRIQPDVVHVQDHFFLGRALAATAAFYDVPLVATNHLMPENFFDHVPVPAALRAPAARWLWRDLARVYAGARVVTSPTPRAVELLQRNTGREDARAVSCGVDSTPYAEAAQHVRPDPDHPTVLFVGRLDAEKRVDELLRAFAALPATLAGARLEIVGKGPRSPEWIRLAHRLGLGDRVRFAAFVSDAELVEAYARAAVFCMPSVAELQSIATLEAMSAGTAVVAADAMALPHLVQNGVNGYLFTPGDVDGLSHRLAALLADPGLRARMGAQSQLRVADHAFGRTLDAFEQVYAEVSTMVGATRRPLSQPMLTSA